MNGKKMGGICTHFQTCLFFHQESASILNRLLELQNNIEASIIWCSQYFYMQFWIYFFCKKSPKSHNIILRISRKYIRYICFDNCTSIKASQNLQKSQTNGKKEPQIKKREMKLNSGCRHDRLFRDGIDFIETSLKQF